MGLKGDLMVSYWDWIVIEWWFNCDLMGLNGDLMVIQWDLMLI